MPVPILALAGLGVGAYKMIKSASAEKKARQELEAARRNRTDYIIPDEFRENVDLTAQQSSTGIGSAAEDFYATLTDRSLANSADAVLASGGSVNSLQELLDKYNQSQQQLAVTDANARRTNIGSYMDANIANAGQKLIRDFGVPNERQRNDIASLNNSIYNSQQGFNNGLSDITSSAAAFVAGGGFDNLSQKTTNVPANASVPNPYVTGNNQTVMTEAEMFPQQNQVPYYLQQRQFNTQQQQIDKQLNNRWGQYQF